jgi:nitrile hydratase accessory protein
VSEFAEPWEARAFAMVRALQNVGLLSSREWTNALSTEIGRAQQSDDPDDGRAYYHQWLAALESVVTEKDLIPAETLVLRRTAWARAAARTPHGDPIELRPEDFDG